MGFILGPDEAQDWIEADPRNAEVIFPYLNGEDLNSRPDTSAPRWVIDFNDRPEEEAAEYRLPYERLLERVKPERGNEGQGRTRGSMVALLASTPGVAEGDQRAG